MSEVVEVANRVRAFFRERFDHETGGVYFTPQLEPGRGDVGTGAFLEQGARLRLAPERISAEFVETLPAPLRERASLASGYLNLTLDAVAPDDIPFVSGPPIEGGASLVLPPPSPALQGWEYHRLASAALLQASALQRDGVWTELRVGPLLLPFYPTDGATDETLARSCRALLELPPEESEAALRAVSDALDETAGARVFLWIAPHTFNRARFRSLLEPRRASPLPLSLRCPERSWFSPLSTDLDPGRLRSLDDDRLVDALFVLAGWRNAPDFDPSMLLFEEAGNSRWYARFTRARVERRLEGASLPEGAVRLDGPSRTLEARALLVDAFYKAMGRLGETARFTRGLEELLRSANYFMNGGRPSSDESGSEKKTLLCLGRAFRTLVHAGAA